MRIMHVLNTRKYSGAENVVITLISATRDKVDAVYVSMDGPIRTFLEEAQISFRPITKMTVSEIRRVIREINPDIIQAHDYTAGIICSIATKKPIINHVHNNSPWIKQYGLRSFGYAISCIKYKRILTVSDAVMNEFVFGSFFNKKTVVIGNPIDIEKIRKMSMETLYDNSRSEYDVAWLGRLTPQKNPLLFLRIIKELQERNKLIRVIMIGDGELRSSVESCIKDYGLENNVDKVGFMKNPFAMLTMAKILCMPSKWEGFGLAAIEALALGKPVICSCVGGLPQIVDESCGKICNSVQEYVLSIERALDDKEYYQRMSQGSIRKAEKMSNLNAYSAEILDIYDEIIGS